ncbi:MAG: hypothetical protein DPW16_00390 [Chloroflexi bacterium]|nr:hypothetical protein [Chloroflexota bacterium]
MPSYDPTPTDDKTRIELYQHLVIEYEKLDEQIDALLMRNNGHTEGMPDADYRTYRELAERRDEVHNQILVLEKKLLDDEK